MLFKLACLKKVFLYVAQLKKKVLSHLARKEMSTVVTVVGLGTVATGAHLKNEKCSTVLAQLNKSAPLNLLI